MQNATICNIFAQDTNTYSKKNFASSSHNCFNIHKSFHIIQEEQEDPIFLLVISSRIWLLYIPIFHSRWFHFLILISKQLVEFFSWIHCLWLLLLHHHIIKVLKKHEIHVVFWNPVFITFGYISTGRLIKCMID